MIRNMFVEWKEEMEDESSHDCILLCHRKTIILINFDPTKHCFALYCVVGFSTHVVKQCPTSVHHVYSKCAASLQQVCYKCTRTTQQAINKCTTNVQQVLNTLTNSVEHVDDKCPPSIANFPTSAQQVFNKRSTRLQQVFQKHLKVSHKFSRSVKEVANKCTAQQIRNERATYQRNCEVLS